jgi:tetratricopeptide (TPR) repeat protein
MSKPAQHLWAAGCVIASVVLSGCATHRARTTGDAAAPLEAFMAQVRAASLTPRAPRDNDAQSVETTDPELAAARLLVATSPTAEHHRRLAEAYARLGVRDAAYDHFTIALKLNPRDAGSYDGLARIWRDWGLAGRGLSVAYHALYYAPDEPAPHNTLGTLLVSLGQPAAARAEFERALARDPGAGYAMNNICYAALLDGDYRAAIPSCRAAIAANPGSTTAHNNLALAYAAANDLASASREFLASGDAGAERYNIGVALMATRRYAEAAVAFDQAAGLRPWVTVARERAGQARALAAEQPR